MKKIEMTDHQKFLNDLADLSEEENLSLNNEEDIFLSEGREINITNNIISSEITQNISKSKLLNNLSFIKFLDEIENNKFNRNVNPQKVTKESIIYQLISESNRYITEINSEMNLTFKLLKEVYSERFPELASIILNAYEYAMTVKELGNNLEVNKADFSYLPNNIQLSLNVVASTTTGKLLNKEKISQVFSLSNDIIKMNFYKKQIISYIETQMSILCPNLTALIGSNIAAKLVTAAGGIVELSKMPASNVLVMGSQRLNLEGFSTQGKLHRGYLSELEEVENTPDKHKMKMLRRYAGKAVLMARVDAFRTTNNIKVDTEMINDSLDINDKMIVDQNDYFNEPKEGIKFKEEIALKMNKIIEPQQAKMKKPLPRPDDKPRRTRGGRNKRNLKARFELTEMRLMKNRMKFGTEAENEFRGTGQGLGLLGIGGTGSKMKAKAKVQKISTKKQKLLSLESQQYSNKDSQSGLHSSVAFTPVEGIELINPHLLEKKFSNVKEKYFSQTSGFSTVISQKNKDHKTIYEI